MKADEWQVGQWHEDVEKNWEYYNIILSSLEGFEFYIKYEDKWWYTSRALSLTSPYLLTIKPNILFGIFSLSLFLTVFKYKIWLNVYSFHFLIYFVYFVFILFVIIIFLISIFLTIWGPSINFMIFFTPPPYLSQVVTFLRPPYLVRRHIFCNYTPLNY